MLNTKNLHEWDEALIKENDAWTEKVIDELEVKEKEFLGSLLTKKLEIENLENQISGLNANKSDTYFSDNIHKLIIEKNEKIKKINESVSDTIKKYVEPLNDEGKKHVFEIMVKNWFKNFVINNVKDFWESINKQLAEQMVKEWNIGFIVNNLEKFEWLDKEVANMLIK